ncbi:uncharacterized protein METZ01_LOCUS260607, partial [marine metagenome]
CRAVGRVSLTLRNGLLSFPPCTFVRSS